MVNMTRIKFINFGKNILRNFPCLYTVMRWGFYYFNRKNKSLTFDIRSINHIENKSRTHGRLAFVSILPPERSGIATTSFFTFLQSDIGIDLYSPVTNVHNFEEQKRVLAQHGTTLFHLQDLLSSLDSYNKVIVCVGNSYHHNFICNLLKEINLRNASEKVVLYLHDIYVLNIILGSGEFGFLQFLAYCAKLYGKPNNNIVLNILKIIKNKVYGLRFFLYLYGVTNYLVNSRAAYNILKHDIGDSAHVSCESIFLPVLDPSAFMQSATNKFQRLNNYFYIGTFGIPGKGKLTEDVVLATRILNNQGINVKLIIAGWNAADYPVGRNNKDVVLIDSPNDCDLIEIMKKTDLAIQLRESNMGESSGCVPLLLSLKIPTIVSWLGSFIEFGQAVIPFYNNGPEVLAELIKKSLLDKNRPDSNLTIEDYVKQHSPERFVEMIYSIYK